MDYTLKVSQKDIQTLFAALGEMPLKSSIGAFSSIQQQVIAQDEISAQPLSDLGLTDIAKTMAGNGTPPPPVKPT